LQALLLALTLAIMAVVLIPCVTGQTSDPHWDMDPRGQVDSSGHLLPTRDLGPADVAWLQVVAVGLAGLALAAHVAAGGRLRWMMVALAGAGGLAAAWHRPQHIDSLSRGGDWIAAFAVALAAIHLAQHQQPRRWLAAGLIALLPTLAIQAATYVFYDHRQTVEYFREHQSAITAGRAMLPGTAAYEQYVRRMQDWAAFGAFGLSNVFGSIAMALTCLAGACAGSLWLRGDRRRAAAGAALTCMGLFAMALSRSRGAGLTLGLVVLMVLILGPRRLLGCGAKHSLAAPGFRWRAIFPLLLPFVVIALVLVRGWMGPPWGHASLSLYFRYLYWQGALHLLLARPALLLAGIGAGGFQDAFAHFKSAYCPEDVISTHNVWLDLIAMLGAGGLAWSAFLFSCLWPSTPAPLPVGEVRVRAASPGPSSAADPAESSQPRPAQMIPALALTVVVFGIQARMQPDILATPTSVLAWAASAMSFLGLLSLLVSGQWLDATALDAGLLLAATALLTHGQIEMTFHQPGACILAVLIMGLACSRWHPRGTGGRRWGGWLAAILLFCAALAMAGWYALPVTRQQAALANGAERWVDQDYDGTLRQLQAACAAVPTDPRAYRWRIWIELTRARAMDAGNPAAQQADFRAIADILTSARAAGLNDDMLLRVEAGADQQRWQLLHDPGALSDAQTAWRELVRRSPYNARSWLELALVQLDLHQYAEAKTTFAQALVVGERLSMDPAGPLTSAERQRFEDRWHTAAPASEPHPRE
jgi:uncharacterized membrane protein YjjB (DUF3815 family)